MENEKLNVAKGLQTGNKCHQRNWKANMRKAFLIGMGLVMAGLTACSENYSNGERIGFVTQFSNKGLIWKSWEGHLNMTQTGMNSSIAFDFSVDNDSEPAWLVARLDSAAQFGWKVKLIYHQTFGKNWLNNRGSTSCFVSGCEILDRTPLQNPFGNYSSAPPLTGKVVDTIYVIIDKSRD